MPLAINPYQLIKTYDASNFFNEFSYFNYPDPTNGAQPWILTELSRHSPSIGDVNYVDRNTAIATDLTYINDAGHIVLKVDDKSYLLEGQKRNSVRLGSVDSFGFGTIWVLDAYHTPYGCRYVV